MAPEQFRGERADARSDQFAFCITLWEALYGQRPFASHERSGLARLIDAVIEGEIDPPPAGSAPPAWLGMALRRGLAPTPSERWPGMDALLEFLRERPRRRARIAKAGAVGSCVAGALTLGLASAERAPYCELDEAAFAEVWDGARRDDLHAAYRASGVASAELAATSASEHLDRWRQGWLGTQRQACEDTRITGIASAARLDERTSCLRRQRRDFAATVEVLAHADARVVGQTAELLAGLPELERCAIEDLRSPYDLPTDEHERSRLEHGYDLLARADALRRIGTHAEATQLAHTATQLGLTHAHPPLALRARAITARLQLDGEAVDDGAQAMLEVIREAERTRLDPLVADLRVQLANGVAGRWSQPSLEAMVFEDAKTWLGRSEITGGPAHQLALVEITLMLERGELEGARAALARLRTEPPPTDELRLRQARLAGRLLAQLGQPTRAREELERLVTQFTASWGPGAKVVADLEFDLGLMALESGELDLAARTLALAEEHYLALFGPDSANVVSVALARARIALARGEIERAQRSLEGLVLRAEAAFGPHHIDTGDAYNALGVTRFFSGDLEESLSAYRRALAIIERVQGEHHPDVANQRSNIGETLAALGRHEAALAMYRVALEDLALAYPPDHLDHAYPLKGSAKSLIALGRTVEAIPRLERALELHSGERAEPFERADVLRSLALALATRDLPRARALAREANTLFESLGMHEEQADLTDLLDDR